MSAVPAHAERGANDRIGLRELRNDTIRGARFNRSLRQEARAARFAGQGLSSSSFSTVGGLVRHTTQVHNFASDRSLNLDLGSNARSITLGTNLFGEATSVTVEVGNKSRQLEPGDSVTAAEFIALTQKFATGMQGLTLDNQGRAVSGDVMLDALRDGNRTIKADSLVIPEGVTGIGNLAKSGDFRITGDLINYGSLVGLSRKDGSDKARISADSITNYGGGTITTALSQNMRQNNPDALLKVDLLLKSSTDLTNHGSIESSGSLTLSASGKIVNESMGDSTAEIIAHHDLNLDSSHVVNHGQLTSRAGDVNFSTETPQDITLDNSGGRVSALDGNINIRDAGTIEKVHTVIWGGDLQSKALNINSGNGVVNVNAHDILGTINVNAGEAHVTAETADLVLGQFNLSGDPTFYNSNGNITINSDLVFPSKSGHRS